MLAIAIKNSLILALVILIAHFLLKNSGDEKMMMGSMSTTNPAIEMEMEMDISPTQSCKKKDDLYSYVYGGMSDEPSLNTATPLALPISAPVSETSPTSDPLIESCADGEVIPYDGGLSEQWCML